MTESNEKSTRRKTVSVPVCVTITVPLDVELDIPEGAGEHSDELGCTVVDAEDCPEQAIKMVKLSQSSESVNKAFDSLMSVAMRHKEAHPETDVYYTSYAGLIEEQKL